MKKLVLTLIVGLTAIQIMTAQSGVISGKVADATGSLQGVNIIIKGTTKGAMTDYDGNYTLRDIPVGAYTITASFIGFKSVTKNIDINTGENRLNFTLIEDTQMLESIVVTTQKTEEKVHEVPVAISVLSSQRITSLETTDMAEISDYIPGLNIQVQSNQRPSIAIRGITGGGGPGTQPRVSIFNNYSPIGSYSATVLEPYDLERIEVVKGPQGTLFGRGAQIGALHYIPQAPKNFSESQITIGGGDYNFRHLTAMVNIPLAENKLLMRIAGTHDYRDGFIKNTFGGTLNGKNTSAGRFSLRYMPDSMTKLDLVLDYQKDDAPGAAFLSKSLPNTNGEIDIYSGVASFERGEGLYTRKENISASLIWKQTLNDNLALTSISSTLKHLSGEWYDGDGTAAQALDIFDDNDNLQFYQELRLNYKPSDKFNTFFGASYFTEDQDFFLDFATDERSSYWLITNPNNLVDENGQPILIDAVPADVGDDLAHLIGTPFPERHIERLARIATNAALDLFVDATFNPTEKLSLTGGLRYTNDYISFGQTTSLIQQPSTLGLIRGNSPNFFWREAHFPKEKEHFSALTGRFIAKYTFSERFNSYLSYSRGRRPNVLQFEGDGSLNILEDETIDSYDLGFKSAISNKMNMGAALFYHNYNNFQTFVTTNITGGVANFTSIDAGKATAYGVELDFNYALKKGLIFFGNYAYIHARFNDSDSDGSAQRYAGNRFRLTPDHSFSLGLDMNLPISKNINLFALPSYTYKSKIFFSDANSVDENDPDNPDNPKNEFQEGYGVFNINLGFEFPSKGLRLAFFAKNLFDTEYFIDAGNTGGSFGIPTYVPGTPQFIGAKMSWSFSQK